MSTRVSARARTRAPERAGDDGFTLIEVIVALALFAVMATLATGFMLSAVQTSKMNSDRILAANIARSHFEELRSEGTTNIKPGLTIIPADDGVPPDAGNGVYTIRTTANWTAIDQTTSSCVNAAVLPNYMNVHVEVTSPTLTDPEVVDGLLQPDIQPAKSSSVVIKVTNQDSAPVSDVTVSLVDLANPSNNGTYITGVDGCLLIRGLTAPSVLTVSIARPGYVPYSPSGTVQTVAIALDAVSEPPAFKYAAGSTTVFSADGGDYDVPTDFPISWQLNYMGAGTNVATQGQTVTGEWPLPGGFTAWLGTCSDSDPESHQVPRTTYAFVAGGGTVVNAASAPVLIRGLDPDTDVVADYIGPDASCTPSSVDLGSTNDQGELKVGLPYGLWKFTGGGEVQTLATPLKPNPDGTVADPRSVKFSITDRAAALASATSLADDARQAALAAGVPTNYGPVTGSTDGTDHPDVVGVSPPWTCTAFPVNPVTPGSRVSAGIGGGYTITCAKAE